MRRIRHCQVTVLKYLSVSLSLSLSLPLSLSLSLSRSRCSSNEMQTPIRANRRDYAMERLLMGDSSRWWQEEAALQCSRGNAYKRTTPERCNYFGTATHGCTMDAAVVRLIHAFIYSRCNRLRRLLET